MMFKKSCSLYHLQTCYFQCEYILRSFTRLFFFLVLFHVLTSIWWKSFRIKLSGDFDITPGPERKTAETNLTLFIWNLNLHSIHAQNFANLCLLKSYVFIIYLECLFKTYLDSETLFDDEKLKIENYRLIRYDHPCNTDRSCVCGVCVHYKIRLSLKVLGIH